MAAGGAARTREPGDESTTRSRLHPRVTRRLPTAALLFVLVMGTS
jgi:hypothetical protein